MKKLKRRLLAIAAAGALALGAVPAVNEDVAYAADISSYTAADIAKAMGLGWNLGNSLDANGSWASGLNTETCWGNPKTTKAMIDDVKAKGFNTIRVPVSWYQHLDSNYKVNAQWMARVKEVVNYGIDNNMYVILNVHHDEWNKPTTANYSAASNELKILWQQIATEFKDYDKHLVFEGMNEPRNYGGSHEWDGGTAEMREVVNKLNADFVTTVRATGGNNSTRALMVPTYAASCTTAAMNAWTRPNNDPNIIASIHAYTPYNFAMNCGTGSTPTFSASIENELKSLFNQINSIYLAKGVPVCIGEFGATDKGNSAERVKWATSFAKQASENGISICLWDNNTVTNENPQERYGAYDRNNMRWFASTEPMVNALVANYKYISISSGDTEGKSTTISSATLTASGWNPSNAIQFDFSQMVEGSYITMKYDTSLAVPTLIVQSTDSNYSVWAKVEAAKLADGVAYFSYNDILSSYKAGFVSSFGRNPSPDFEYATQAFASAENRGSVKVTNVSYLVPAKYMKGDVDLDGKVTVTDYAMIIAFSNSEINLSSQQVYCADYNGDDMVNYIDAALVLDFISK